MGPGGPVSVTTPAPPPLEPELERLLRRLRLPYMRAHAPEVLATAKAQRWDPAEVLRVLLAEEATGRDRATIALRRRQAGFPTGKTIEAFRAADSAIPPQTQQALLTLEWLMRAENLVVCGPSGTGKSHFVEALGHAAIDSGRTVAWFTLESLGALVRRHRTDDSMAKAMARVIRADLIVVDDIGMLPVGQDASEALFRLVDAAYEKRSVAVTSNLHPAGFDELMPKTLATATVDRLLHHAHMIVTHGESVRLAEASAGRGVVPLWPTSPATTTADPSPTARPPPGRGGEILWPPVGRTGGRQWGDPVTARGEFPVAVDTGDARRRRRSLLPSKRRPDSHDAPPRGEHGGSSLGEYRMTACGDREGAIDDPARVRVAAGAALPGWRPWGSTARAGVREPGLNPLDQRPEPIGDGTYEVLGDDRGARKLAWQDRGRRLQLALPRLCPLPLRPPPLGPARTLLPVRRDALGDLASPDEGEVQDADGATAVAARLGLGQRPVPDQADAHRVEARAPLRPARHAHRPRQLGRSYLAPVPPGPQRELGHDEPAQDVGDPATAQARLGEDSQDRLPHRGEALAGKGLDLERPGGVAHEGLAISGAAVGLAAVRGRGYSWITAQ